MPALALVFGFVGTQVTAYGPWLTVNVVPWGAWVAVLMLVVVFSMRANTSAR